MKRLAVLTVTFAFLAAVANNPIKAGDKTTLCHFDQGGDTGVVIDISVNAVTKHLLHGDYEIEAEVGTACPALE